MAEEPLFSFNLKEALSNFHKFPASAELFQRDGASFPLFTEKSKKASELDLFRHQRQLERTKIDGDIEVQERKRRRIAYSLICKLIRRWWREGVFAFYLYFFHFDLVYLPKRSFSYSVVELLHSLFLDWIEWWPSGVFGGDSWSDREYNFAEGEVEVEGRRGSRNRTLQI